MSESDHSADDASTRKSQPGTSVMVTTGDEVLLYVPSNPSTWLKSDTAVDLATRQ